MRACRSPGPIAPAASPNLRSKRWGAATCSSCCIFGWKSTFRAATITATWSLRQRRGQPKSMHKTVLITGGAGFVGSTLAIAIRRAHPGTNVIAFDNLRRRGSEMNLPRLRSEGVQFVHGDVRALADLTGIRPAPDLILECSAEPSVL